MPKRLEICLIIFMVMLVTNVPEDGPNWILWVIVQMAGYSYAFFRLDQLIPDDPAS